MIKVGNKEVIFSSMFLIPEGEKAEFDLNYNNTILKVIISFDDSGDVQEIEVNPLENGDVVELIFKKWSKSLGAALKEHVELGRNAKGVVLKFIASNTRVGNINQMNIQFVVETV